MAYDTVIDKARQQAACKATADAIRGKTGSTAKLTWDPDTGFKNAVNAISTGSTGITPTGTKTITMNGTHNVGEYEYAQVNVETTADPTLQSKSVIPQATTQTVKPDTGYDGLFQVTVNGDADLIASNIKKGVQIFNITGTYEGTGTSGSTGITPTGTKIITTNGTHDVTSYAHAEVNVPTTGGDVVGGDIEVYDLSELHSWNKYSIPGLVETNETNVFIGTAQHGKSITVEYANEIDTTSGSLSLSTEGYSTANVTSDASGGVLKGKVIRTNAGLYYRIPSDATVDHQNGTLYDNLYVSKAARLTYTSADDALLGVVVSENSSAYPQNGLQDGYKYVYIGTLDNSSCDHTSVAQATPVITVSSSGVITATSTQSAGLVSAGTKTATKSDANLVAGNIKQGVSIFGVTGTYVGASGEATQLDGAYVWQKCTIDSGWHYTTEELGTTKPSDLTGTVRKSFTITEDGYFELSTETSTLGGYYSISGGNGKSIYNSVWHYASSGSYYTYSKLTLPNSTDDAKGQFVSYVTSDSENAYPNNGASGGYWYVKLVAVDAA